MTRAMQEQQAQIKAQRDKIENLELRLKAMETRYGSPLEQRQNGEQ
jgi:hypothetical protein